MTVTLLDLKAQNGALEAELRAAFERVLRSGLFHPRAGGGEIRARPGRFRAARGTRSA